MLNYLILASFCIASQAFSMPSWDTAQANDLVYGEGSIEVNTQISAYENIIPNAPIEASVMITHPSKSLVDVGSFQMGGRPIKVNLESSVAISSYSDIEISIYKFQIEGLPEGFHTLPPVKVKVGGREYASEALNIAVGE